jgi:hypothetical protein
MSFDRRDIRRAMDVFTQDNVYLGTVLAVRRGPPLSDWPRVPVPARQSSEISAERLGPAPTEPLGNPGPRTQSARAEYATQPDRAEPLGRGSLLVGRWWGLLGRREIPLEAVQSVSFERVVLRLRGDQL